MSQHVSSSAESATGGSSLSFGEDRSCVVRLLNVFTVTPYEPMTFLHYRPRLRDISTSSPIVAVGAACKDRPIGLGLAELSSDGRRGSVLSVFVSPAHRNRGFGRALLTRLEAELQTRGCTEVEFVYSIGTAPISAIERILERLGWRGPEARMLLCFGNRRDLVVPWMRRSRPPAGFALVSWSELTADDQSAMLRKQELQPWYPEALSPFFNEEMRDPATSLCLRHEGEIAGWLVTHRVSERTIRYSSLFIRADLRRRGCALPLVAEALRRQARHYGLDSFGLFAVSLANLQMVRFVRRLEPSLLSVRETRVGYRSFI